MNGLRRGQLPSTVTNKTPGSQCLKIGYNLWKDSAAVTTAMKRGGRGVTLLVGCTQFGRDTQTNRGRLGKHALNVLYKAVIEVDGKSVEKSRGSM